MAVYKTTKLQSYKENPLAPTHPPLALVSLTSHLQSLTRTQSDMFWARQTNKNSSTENMPAEWILDTALEVVLRTHPSQP